MIYDNPMHDDDILQFVHDDSYTAVYTEANGTESKNKILGWAVTRDGSIRAVDADRQAIVDLVDNAGNFARLEHDAVESELRKAAHLDATLDIAVQLDRIGNQLEHIARTLDTLAQVDRG